MDPAQPSRTAMGTSLMRATHTRDPLPLINDPFGDRWLVQARAIYAERMRETDPNLDVDQHLRSNPAYANVITRARFCEDALEAAVRRGINQYVIVGAGFDSFAQRRPDWARDLTIIEVDHPATQAFKLQRLGPDRAGAHYVGADLGAEPLGEALKRSPFNFAEPAFFAWLGVTMYLPRAANFACFREIARVGGQGGELVFSYAHIRRFDEDIAPDSAHGRMREAVKSLGEPFICGFDPATLGQELGECGLDLVEDLGVDELLKRYDPAGVNQMRGDSLGRVARALIV